MAKYQKLHKIYNFDYYLKDQVLVMNDYYEIVNFILFSKSNCLFLRFLFMIDSLSSLLLGRLECLGCLGKILLFLFSISKISSIKLSILLISMYFHEVYQLRVFTVVFQN